MLRWAYFALRPAAGAGVDGVTWDSYGERLAANLEGLHGRLTEGRYRAPKVRRTYIPKGNGKLRPLGIPSLEDKIVQRAVAEILTAVFDGDFVRGSYGYRRGIGAKDAALDLRAELQCGTYGYVVEADIRGFFDAIDHDWLLKMLEQRVADQKLLRLIRKWLKAGILEPDGTSLHPASGTPQGGIVSPILANVYLHYALDLWFEKVFKRGASGRCFLIRYADDFVAGFQHRSDAWRFEKLLSGRLGKFALEVEPSKTGMHTFSRFMPRDGGSFDFLGFTYRWQLSRSGVPGVRMSTAKAKFRRSVAVLSTWLRESRNWPAHMIFSSLRKKLRGYWNYYSVRGNSFMLNAMWREAWQLLYKWLNRRSQRRSYNVSGLNAALGHYCVPRPRIDTTAPLRPPPSLWRLA